MTTEKNPHFTYCPRNYRRSREVTYGMKVLFLIYDKIPLTNWKVLEANDFVEWLQIHTADETLNIINVYNPPGPANELQISKWPQIKQILEATFSANTLLVGDFNTHHPEWAGIAIRQEPKADHLLRQTTIMGFQLLNEPGATTWSRGRIDSVLDLGFASRRLTPRIMAFKPRRDWSNIQDHFPIEIRIDMQAPYIRKSRAFAL